MRLRVIVPLFVLVTACHLPSLRGELRAIGAQTAAVIKQGVAPVRVEQRVEPRPVAMRESRPRAPSSRPAPVIPVSYHRTQAPPSVFVFRGVTFGGYAVCQAFPTMDACSTYCTDRIRLHTANPLATPDPHAISSCACTELDRGC